MKKINIILIILIAISSCFLNQASANPEIHSKKIIITGTLNNYNKNKFTLSYDVYSLLNTTQNKQVKIDANGNFKTEINVASPLTGKLSFGKVMKGAVGHYRYIYIYLEPGDHLNIEADIQNIQKTLSFSGSGVANNNYVNQEDYTFNSYAQRILNNHDYITNKQPDEYKKTVEEIRDKKLDFLENYAQNNNLSDKLINIYQDKYVNLATIRKINYPYGHKQFNDGVAANLPSDYYDFLDEVTLPSDISNKGISYLRFMNACLTHKYELAEKSGYKKDYLRYLKSELEGRTLYIYMAYYLNRDFKANMYNQFDEDCPYPEIAKIVKKKYKHLESMLPGNAVPPITLTEVNGNTKMLSAFKGQNVYIDFWATWCKPCIKEIPYIDKLKEEYKDKNIQFISISFNSEEEVDKWKKFVQEKNLGKLQFWVNAKNHTRFSKTFNIRMIPRFVLIDDEGNIVDAKAPRPSEAKKVRSLINKQLHS